MFLDWLTSFKFIPDMLQGAALSMGITLVVFVLSILLGTMVGFVRYSKKNKLVYGIATIYVEIIRNTPLLVQIFFLYFGLPQLGIYLPALVAGVLGLSLNNAAYVAEIVRSGINSIPIGQWEASSCIGLGRSEIFINIIFPQALRNIFPALINQFIMILFGTSLLSALDIRDLTQVVSIINSQNFRTVELFVIAIAIYYILSLISSKVLRYINDRFFPSISKGR